MTLTELGLSDTVGPASVLGLSRGSSVSLDV